MIFFRDFVTNVSHAFFARRGHSGLSVHVGKEVAMYSCGHTEYFTPAQQPQTADCGDAALW